MPARSFPSSKKAVSKIVAELFMVLITIILSGLVFIWVVPTFQNTTGTDRGTQAYLESFSTTSGDFALSTRVQDEPVRTSPSAWSPNRTCNGSNPVNTPYSGSVFVPVDAVCSITAQVTGNVFVASGATLTVTGTTITGTLNGNYSSSITVWNSHINQDMGSYSAVNVLIYGSQIGGDLYVGGRAVANMTSSTVGGEAEFEVNQAATIVGNTIGGLLEAEDDNTAQVTSNTAAQIDTDGNGAVAVSYNHVTGTLNFGRDNWCAANGNTAGGGTTGSCVGTVRVDVMNTGPTPVTLQALYVGNNPSAGVTWSLASGHSIQCGNVIQTTPCTVLPVIIPVKEVALLKLVWAPGSTGYVMTTVNLVFQLVSNHSNFVDGHLIFGIGLAMTSTSHLLNRVCPPCQ